MTEIKKDTKKIKEDNCEIVNSQEHISDQYDDICKKLEKLQALEKHIQQLDMIVREKDKGIVTPQSKLNQLEQYGQQKNI